MMEDEIDLSGIMPDLPNKARFTPKEAAMYLGVHVNTVYRWIDEGRMEGAVQLGVKLKRIPRQSIIDQLIMC